MRRHTQWLYSVEPEALAGHGYALTLTVRDLPSQQEWARMKQVWMVRQRRRSGFLRLHWVVEWQRRGVPHLHVAVYYDRPLLLEGGEIVIDWLAAAKSASPMFKSQHFDTIDGPLGWLKYLSKHAARGVEHYQRQGTPEGWETTGRLWGKAGEWPTVETRDVDLPRDAWFWYRRQLRSWRKADARAEGDPRTRARRITSARRMLRANTRERAEVRGVSEWVPAEVQMMLLRQAAYLYGGVFEVLDDGDHSHLLDLETGEVCHSIPTSADAVFPPARC